MTTSSTSNIGYSRATTLCQPPPVARCAVSPSSWATMAAAPTEPIAASSHSAGVMRTRRRRANSSAAANTRGKNASRTRSAWLGKRVSPPGQATQIAPIAWASTAAPSASHAPRSSRRRSARSSTATAAVRIGRPAARTRITRPAIGAVAAELDPLDECWWRRVLEAAHAHANGVAASPGDDRVGARGAHVAVGGVGVVDGRRRTLRRLDGPELPVRAGERGAEARAGRPQRERAVAVEGRARRARSRVGASASAAGRRA